MANVDEEMIKYLAELSRIAVSGDEKEALLKDLRKILKYVEQLNEVDTANVAPCTYVTQALKETPLRDDVPMNSLTRDAFLKDAPLFIAGMVRVPPVLKQDQ
jgi:aspartyl-tRNA(Asn)/glutamyl-tRNA(Gln) amidotransferase subunit C